MELLYISFGWLLGLLSPLIVDAALKRRETPTLYRTLLQELDDLRYRLVMSSYRIQESRGRLSQEILTWTLQVVNQYQGIYRSEQHISDLRRLASAPENELHQRSGLHPKGHHVRLRAFEAPFLERLIPDLHRFGIDVQRNLLDIRAQLRFFNKLSDDQEEMLAASWDQSLSDSNRRRVETNLQTTYDDAVDRAKSIVNRIGILPDK